MAWSAASQHGTLIPAPTSSLPECLSVQATAAHSVVLRPNGSGNCSLLLEYHILARPGQAPLLVLDVESPRVLALLRCACSACQGLGLGVQAQVQPGSAPLLVLGVQSPRAPALLSADRPRPWGPPVTAAAHDAWPLASRHTAAAWPAWPEARSTASAVPKGTRSFSFGLRCHTVHALILSHCVSALAADACMVQLQPALACLAHQCSWPAGLCTTSCTAWTS